MSKQAPTGESERIDILDVLRGLGVLGILAVNAAAFAYPVEAYYNPLNSPFPFEGLAAETWRVVHVFFEQKFVTLFSMLFGVSLFLVGGERGDAERTALLQRRLFWLAVIGIVHGAAVWFGDILLAYAVAGFVVSFARSWGASRLMAWGVLIYFAGAAIEAASAVVGTLVPLSAEELAQMNKDMGWRLAPEELRDAIAAFSGTFDQSLMANLTTWLEFLWLLFFPKAYGLMMIGLGLFKMGYLQGKAPAWVHAILVILGACALALMNQSASQAIAAGFPMLETLGQGRVPLAFGALFATLGYVSALMLLHAAVGTGGLWALAATGRMAFTNYLTQSLIMTAIFFGGRGLGLFGQLNWPDLAVVVMGVWALQLAWSPLWLSAFSMGPLEWVWRCLTYGRLLPIRRRHAAS
jgi:uncharacterized protein